MTKTEYSRLWRAKNPLLWATIQRRRYDRRVDLICRLKGRPCADCGGWFDHWQMEFDHKFGNKRYCVSSRKTNPLRDLLHEIAQCDVVCANCHKDRTYRRQQNDRRRSAN